METGIAIVDDVKLGDRHPSLVAAQGTTAAATNALASVPGNFGLPGNRLAPVPVEGRETIRLTGYGAITRFALALISAKNVGQI
jgi:hypothetical protein